MKLRLSEFEFCESRLRIYSVLGVTGLACSYLIIRYAEKNWNVHDPTFLIVLLVAGVLFLVSILALVTSSVGAIVLLIQMRRFTFWSLMAFSGLAVICFLLSRFLQAD